MLFIDSRNLKKNGGRLPSKNKIFLKGHKKMFYNIKMSGQQNIKKHLIKNFMQNIH